MTNPAEVIAFHDGEGGRRFSRRKNTRRWCKGKKGREHTTIVQHQKVRNQWRNNWVCGNWLWGSAKGEWRCWHEEICTTCGKVVRWSLGEDCPDRPRAGGDGGSGPSPAAT